MADLFKLYERADSYDKRLIALIDSGKLKITEADLKAIRCLREDRNRLLELVHRFKRLRDTQKELERYRKLGIGNGPGHETAVVNEMRLASECDNQIETTIEELE